MRNRWALSVSAEEFLPRITRITLKRTKGFQGKTIRVNLCFAGLSLPGVLSDCLGYVEGGIFTAHVVRAHLAFRDDAGDPRLKTRRHFCFFKPVEHQLC